MDKLLLFACGAVLTSVAVSIFKDRQHMVAEDKRAYNKRKNKFLREREYIDAHGEPKFEAFGDYIESELNPMEIRFLDNGEEV
jgi:ribosomal protein S17